MNKSARFLDLFQQGMQYDFCPWANRYVYWLKNPVGWLVLALLASLLLGLGVSPKAFIASAAILALGTIGAAWPRMAMWGIRGRLAWEVDRCCEGEEVLVRLAISNRWIWPVWGLVVDTDEQVATRPDCPGAPIALSRVPGMARSEFRWTCCPTSRGVFPIKKIRLVTSFPFGLWSYGRDIDVEKELIVWPAVAKLVDLPEQPGATLSSHGALSQRAGQDGDWFGVRPFREGDSLRSVHWAQSARRDSLIVCERQHGSRNTGLLWLDPAAKSTCVSLQQSEWLIRMLASLASQFVHHAWTIQVWMGDKVYCIHPGRDSLEAFMDQLASYQWCETSVADSWARFPDASIHKWMIGLTTVSRYTYFKETMGVMPSSLDWLLLDTATAAQQTTQPHVESGKYGFEDCMVVRDGTDHFAQLSAEWQRYSQMAQRRVCA